MGKERWAQVGDYQVSTYGNVKTSSGRRLKGCLHHSGTIVVHLRDKQIAVSKLVADAFIPGNGKVYHKNGDRTDNRLCNLERR